MNEISGKCFQFLFAVVASSALLLGASCRDEEVETQKDLASEKERTQHARDIRRSQSELYAKEQARKSLEEDVEKLKNDLAKEKEQHSNQKAECDALRQQGAPDTAMCDAVERERDSFERKFDTCTTSLKSLNQDLATLRQKKSMLEGSEQILKQQLQQLQAGCASNQANQGDLDSANQELNRVRAENAHLKQQRNVLRNPTLQELKDFLRDDLTNEKVYDLASYNCKGFTLELRDHARDLGWRSAFVSVAYEGQSVGHAFNAFETTDEGLIYIEPQHDSVRYVELGKKEGQIPLEAVKREFLACEDPSDLRAEMLASVRYTGTLFEYPYFKNYQQRMDCWWKSFQSYKEASEQRNEAVDRFNVAVQTFSSGVQTLAESERLDSEKTLLNNSWDELNKWSANIRLFAEDIGRLTKNGAYLTPTDNSAARNVGEVEQYWN